MDRLASHPTAAFNNVALVAAGGGLVIQKNGGAGSAAYDAAGVAKLALGSAAGAQVVDAEMTGLDRANKAVLLSDGTELPYDVLALATGHRDQTRVAMDAADDVPIERLDDLVSNLTREEAAAIESVLVYGDTLEGLGATRKLLSVGVRPAQSARSRRRAGSRALPAPASRWKRRSRPGARAGGARGAG